MTVTPEPLTYNLREKIQLVAAMLFVATMPYLRSINQVFIVIFLVSCLMCWHHELWKSRKNTILIFTAGYIVALISALLSPDIKAAFKVLEIQSSLLLVPLFFGMSYRHTPIKNDYIKAAFIAGVCAALVYLMVYFILNMNNSGIPAADWLQEKYLNHSYAAPIGIHAGFFSCYVSLSLYFLIIFLTTSSQLYKKAVILLLMLICTVSMFLLASRTNLLLNLVCILFFIPSRLKVINAYIAIPFLALVLSALYLFFSKSDYLQDRFTSDIEKDIKISALFELAKNNDLSFQKTILKNDGSRIERWVAGLNLIKEKPFTGYGVGQEKPVLFKEYTKMGLTVTLNQGYDAHNQFMAYTLKSGIAGLLAFMIMLIYGLTHAIKAHDPVYISFLIIIIGTCMIDNLLEANKGIFFFAFFNIFLFLTTTGEAKRQPVC